MRQRKPVCLVLVLISAVILGACGPSEPGETPSAEAVAVERETQFSARTYGDGGEDLLGGIMAITAKMAQAVELVYRIDESAADGSETRQEFQLRYSQEPIPAR